MSGYSGGSEVDLEKFPTAKALVGRCKDLFMEVENL
jgi:hypothetical protein